MLLCDRQTQVAVRGRHGYGIMDMDVGMKKRVNAAMADEWMCECVQEIN